GDGRVVDCLLPRVARSTRRISFRKRSSIRYGASIASIRGTKARFKRTYVKRYSIEFATRHADSRDGRWPRSSQTPTSRKQPHHLTSPSGGKGLRDTKPRFNFFVQR